MKFLVHELSYELQNPELMLCYGQYDCLRHYPAKVSYRKGWTVFSIAAMISFGPKKKSRRAGCDEDDLEVFQPLVYLLLVVPFHQKFCFQNIHIGESTSNTGSLFNTKPLFTLSSFTMSQPRCYPSALHSGDRAQQLSTSNDLIR